MPGNAGAGATNVAEAETVVAAINLAKTLKYQHGLITLPGNVATVTVPTNLCYLGPDDTATVLEKFWGNPPGPETLGMLIPADQKPYQASFWGVIITATQDGHVKDDDANKINYQDLLKEMRQEVQSENKERREKGFPSVELVGWAEPPRYDAATHKMYWAKDLKLDGEPEDTLNYDIRILGRRGYLVLRAVAGISQLAEIREEAPQILAAVDFKEGDRYADFDPKVDKVAAYGLTALVAGTVAAKLGFFKLLWVGLAAGWKIILVGVAAIGAWLKRIFKRDAKSAP